MDGYRVASVLARKTHFKWHVLVKNGQKWYFDNISAISKPILMKFFQYVCASITSILKPIESM